MKRTEVWLTLVACLWGAGCNGVQHLDFTGAPTVSVGPESPRRFDVTGAAELEVEGFRLVGTFEAELFETAPGSVRLSRLQADLEDRVIVKKKWFKTRRIRLRCTRTQATRPATATLGSTGDLEFPAGSLEVWGISYEDRDPSGGCPGTGDTIRISGSNQDVFGLTHDPAGDSFFGEGAFQVEIAGDLRSGTLTIDGRYRNRPPTALIASVAADAFDLPQGGCPPLTAGNPPYVEANRADGLAATFSSLGSDPDGSFGTADLKLEQWAVYRGGAGSPAAEYLFLGRGRALPATLFPHGHEYTVALLSTDHSGAVSEDRCSFFVAPRP